MGEWQCEGNSQMSLCYSDVLFLRIKLNDDGERGGSGTQQRDIVTVVEHMW